MAPIVPRFYVYVLCRPDGRPFYIGKGSGKRIRQHDTEARTNCDCRKCRVIRKIWQGNGDVHRYILLVTNDEQEAFAYECGLIAAIGREHLTNGTNGGEGGSGRIATDFERQSKRNRRKSDWSDPEYRAKMTLKSQELAGDPEWRANLSRMSKKRYEDDPDLRERASQSQRKRYEDPAEHAKQSAVNHIRWSDPEQRARLAERNRSPEMRAKLSATRKAQWADPEYRAKMLAHRTKRLED